SGVRQGGWGGVAAGGGGRPGGVGPPGPGRRQKGGGSGEWVTQLERIPAPDDRPRPASRSAAREWFGPGLEQRPAGGSGSNLLFGDAAILDGLLAGRVPGLARHTLELLG